MKNLYNKGEYSYDPPSSNYYRRLGNKLWRRHGTKAIADALEQQVIIGGRVRHKAKKKPIIVRFIIENRFGKSKYWARYASLKHAKPAMNRNGVVNAMVIDKPPKRKGR